MVEYHHAESALPHLKVLICRGRKDVTIKVSSVAFLATNEPFNSAVIMLLSASELSLICARLGSRLSDHFVGKESAINPPTMPTQPPIPLESVNE